MGILLEDKEDQDNEVTIEIVKVAMTRGLQGCMVHTHPEQVEGNIVQKGHKIWLILLLSEGLSYIEDKFGGVDQGDAQQRDHELEEPHLLPNLYLVLVHYALVLLPVLLALFESHASSVLLLTFVTTT